MIDPSGASPENDAARTVATGDERATDSNFAGADRDFDTTEAGFMGSGEPRLAGTMGIVIRLPRQVRRGVVITPYNDVDDAGNRCRYKVYRWRLGFGPQGKVFGAPNLLLAQTTAESLSRQFGVPVLDYSAGHGRLPPLDGAA